MPMLYDPYKFNHGRKTVEVSQKEYDELLRLAFEDWSDFGCVAETSTGWLCVLARGHEGDHIAASGGEVHCTWPQECAEPTPPAEEAHA